MGEWEEWGKEEIIGENRRRTKDRRYESNDSLEIENASISSLFLVLFDVADKFDRRGQRPFFSAGGEGYIYSISSERMIPDSFWGAAQRTYREVDSAIVDNWEMID